MLKRKNIDGKSNLSYKPFKRVRDGVSLIKATFMKNILEFLTEISPLDSRLRRCLTVKKEIY